MVAAASFKIETFSMELIRRLKTTPISTSTPSKINKGRFVLFPSTKPLRPLRSISGIILGLEPCFIFSFNSKPGVFRAIKSNKLVFTCWLNCALSITKLEPE